MVSAVKGAKSVMEGIEFLKNYDIVVHPRCRYTADELLAYSYKTDPNTGDVTNILADRKNHVIDALRYAVEEVRRARTTDHKFFGPTVIDLAQFREKGYG
jgi:phage terminase large subunit